MLRRIYERKDRGAGFAPLGWVCGRGHVFLDRAPTLLRN